MMNIDIKQGKPCHSSNYSAGRNGNAIKYIVIHFTSNNGDTAQNNCTYFSGSNRNASAHYFIGDDGIYQSVQDKDRAWHCGGTSTYKHPYCRNANSIGIEMCSRISSITGYYYINDNIVDNAILLTKYLMQKYSIPVDNVLRHYDVWNKKCPEPFVRNPELWMEFKNRLKEDEPMTADERKKFNAAVETIERLSKKVDELSALVNKLDNPMIYNYVDDNMPSWAKDAVQAAINKGIIKGEGEGLGLTYSDLRAIVREYRAGVYN